MPENNGIDGAVVRSKPIVNVILTIGFDEDGVLHVQGGSDQGGIVLLLEKVKQDIVRQTNIVGPSSALSLAPAHMARGLRG